MRVDVRVRGSRSKDRAGVALFEAIVALVILSTAGLTAASLVVDASRAASRVQASELRVRRASAFLESVALWPREDLDRRLGDRPQGPYRLRVVRMASTLYVAQLWDSAGADMLVGTALYRPEQVPRVTQ